MAVDPTAVMTVAGLMEPAARTAPMGKRCGYDCYPYPDRYRDTALADHPA